MAKVSGTLNYELDDLEQYTAVLASINETPQAVLDNQDEELFTLTVTITDLEL